MEKHSVNFAGSIDEAINRFSKDKANSDFSQRELNTLNELKKSLPANRLLPQLFANVPLESNKIVDYLREAKLRINIIGAQSTLLAQEINSASTDFWSTLDDVQVQLKALDSDIQEEEIKAEDKFQVVHFNAFNRPIDLFSNKKPEQDPKTGLPFLNDQLLELIPGAGLTLPLVQTERIFIKNILLLDEESDVGDTATSIIKTDPNYLLDPNLSFRYVIARKAYDDTGRLYNYTESTCTLLVQLGHIQLLNHINLRPASHSPLLVKKIQYLNESNELVTLDTETLSLDANLDVLLEPIRTNNLIITLVQYAPVETTEIFTGDIRKEAINSFLTGSDWSTGLDSPGDFLKARIYDFSLESLKVELLTYRQSGYFLSQPIVVNKPLSFSLALASEAIQVVTGQHTYGSEYFLPEGVVLAETYVKAHFENDKKQKQIDMVIPVPATKGLQTELLPIIGGESKTCFIPNTLYSAFYKRAAQVAYIADYVFIELEEDHGIVEGIIYHDPLEIFTGIETPTLSIISTQWEATGPRGLALKRPDGVNLFASISENATPKAWVLRQEFSEPFAVYREGEKLALGKDYTYSLDNGVTWLSSLITLVELAELPDVKIAGHFKIKILSPDYDYYYWCTYKRAKLQFLHSNKMCILKKNSVVFNKRFKRLSGSLKTLIVLRSDSRIPYLSPVIHNYKLKVRTHELQ